MSINEYLKKIESIPLTGEDLKLANNSNKCEDRSALWNPPERVPYATDDQLKDIKNFIKETSINTSKRFTVLDFCCGHGDVIDFIQKTFPTSECYAFDLHASHFRAVGDYTNTKIKWYQFPFQNLIFCKEKLYERIDLVVTNNVYGTRHVSEKLLKGWTAWIEENSRWHITSHPKKEIKRIV